MRRILSLTVVLAGLVTPAWGQDGDSAVLRGGEREFYIAGVPPGWRYVETLQEEEVTTARWVPEGRGSGNRRDQFLIQVFEKAGRLPPGKFLDRMADQYAIACEEVYTTLMEEALVNRFPAAFRIVACNRNPQNDRGEIIVVRAVGGEEAFYVVQRYFQFPPFQAQNFPLEPKQLEEARAAVEFGIPCRVDNGARPCPPDWRDVLDVIEPTRTVVVFPGDQ